MLLGVADEVLDAVEEAPEGASERAMLWALQARGVSAKTFYGIVAELEGAGLVRWQGGRLFRALLH